MIDIPLELQRRFEQRWAARFPQPVAPVSPKRIGLNNIGLNNQVDGLACSAKEKLTEPNESS
jgi:hypothetical protein